MWAQWPKVQLSAARCFFLGGAKKFRFLAFSIS